jgi:hypothetical protein
MSLRNMNTNQPKFKVGDLVRLTSEATRELKMLNVADRRIASTLGTVTEVCEGNEYLPTLYHLDIKIGSPDHTMFTEHLLELWSLDGNFLV